MLILRHFMKLQGCFVTKKSEALQLFIEIITDEFIRELQFYLDASSGRTSLRADFTDKLISLAKIPMDNLVDKIPIPGLGLITEVIYQGIDWQNDQRKDEVLLHAQTIGYGIEPEKLRIMLESVGMEAACRYQYWITTCLVADPVEGIIPFAKTGVERMLEYVLRKRLPLSIEHLLQGLILGRSGAYISGFNNTKLSVVEEKSPHGLIEKTKNFLGLGRYSAEGAYERTGLRTYDGKLWALKDKNKTAKQLAYQRHKTLEAVNINPYFNAGYTKIIHQNDPKYGHVLVSRMLWQALYGHLEEEETHQSPTELTPNFQMKLSEYAPAWLKITRKELDDYLIQRQQEEGLSLLTYCQRLKATYKSVERIFYSADEQPVEWDLRALSLEGADFSNCVFNHCLFGGSLKGTKWQNAYLREADFSDVSDAEDIDFSSAHMEFIKAPKIDFGKSNFKQAKLLYADLSNAKILGETIGAVWNNANLTNIQANDLETIRAIQKEQGQFAKEQAESLYKLSSMQAHQQQEIIDLRNDLMRIQSTLSDLSIDESSSDVLEPSDLKKFETLSATLLQEQIARLAFTRHCTLSLERLSHAARMGEQRDSEQAAHIEQLNANIAAMKEKQSQFTRFIQETHALSDKVASNEVKVGELEANLSIIVQNFESRFADLSDQVQTLDARVDRVEKIAKQETIEGLCKQLQTYAEHSWNSLELAQLANFYIPLDAQEKSLFQGGSVDLMAKMEHFLFSKEKVNARVCILFGEAGSGKTLFGLMLQKHLWDLSTPSDTSAPTIIPIRIEMKRYNKESAKDCVNTCLKKDYNLTEEAIRSLQCSNHQFIFIFDGFDELEGGGIVKLYQDNRLDQWGINPKVIIGCRSNYFADKPYQALLGPGGEGNNEHVSELHILPFSPIKINHYLTLCAEKGELEGGTVEDYETFLKETPGLSELINTPFLLKIYINAYPGLKQKTTTIVRIDLYDLFMHAWYKKESQKLMDSGESTAANIENIFERFGRELAFAMYEDLKYEVTYYHDTESQWGDELGPMNTLLSNQDKWRRFFSSDDKKTVLARRGCPLRCVNGTTYSFIHQSFLDYFVADKLWDLLIHQPQVQQTQWGVRCLTQKPKMQDVIQFLADRIRTDPQKQLAIANLYAMIEQSKRKLTDGLGTAEKLMTIQAASNAMTVLNFGSVAFTLKAIKTPCFFREIQVPNADLSTAELSNIDFTGADLSNVNLTGAKLRNAVLDHCILTNIDVKQFPMLSTKSPVACVAYSNNGKWMAAGCGQFIQLYRQSKWHWKAVVRLAAHKKDITSLCFSPDSTQLASVGMDHHLQLMTIGDDTLTLGLSFKKGHKGPVRSVVFSPDGRFIATAGNDKTIRIWDVISTKNRPLRGHTRMITALAYTPNGQALISGSIDRKVLLWDVANGKQIRKLATKILGIKCLAVSPDGTEVAVGSSDKAIRILSVENGLQRTWFKGHTDTINALVNSPNGQKLASASDDKTIRLWGVKDQAAGRTLEGHEGGVTSIAFSSNGNQLVSGSKDKTLRLWSIDNTVGPLSEGHSKPVNSIAISSNGCQFASGSDDKSVRIWNMDGTTERVLRDHTNSVSSVAYSSDGSKLASASFDTSIRLFNTETQAQIVIRGHKDSVIRVSFSPHANQLVSCSADRTVGLWDLNACDHGSPPHFLPLADAKGEGAVANEPMNSVAFSPDGQWIGLGYHDGSLRLRDLHGEASPMIYQGHTNEISCVAFSANGRALVTGSLDKTLRLWELGIPLSMGIGHHDEGVNSVSFSPDGCSIVSGGDDKTIKLWQINEPTVPESDGNLLNRLSLVSSLVGHKDAVTSVVFTLDGEFIISGSRDKTIRLWQCAEQGRWVPLWQHPRDNSLIMSGCSMQGIVGLSPTCRVLFRQLGALIVEPDESDSNNSPPKSANEENALTLSTIQLRSSEIVSPRRLMHGSLRLSRKDGRLLSKHGLFSSENSLFRGDRETVMSLDVLQDPSDTPDNSLITTSYLSRRGMVRSSSLDSISMHLNQRKEDFLADNITPAATHLEDLGSDDETLTDKDNEEIGSINSTYPAVVEKKGRRYFCCAIS